MSVIVGNLEKDDIVIFPYSQLEPLLTIRLVHNVINKAQ